MLTITTIFHSSIYFIACIGAGSLIMHFFLNKLNEHNTSVIIKIATRFLLGQGILANLWVFIALPGYFSPSIVISIIAILFFTGIILGYKFFNELPKQFISYWNEIANETVGWKLVISASLMICLAWLPYRGLPLSPDATRFYLALPKVISASHQLKVLPGYEEVASLGLQGEMQFAALMTINSPESVQLFSWLTLIAGCVFLLALSKKIGLNRRSQWLVLAMVFTSSVITYLSGSAKTDMFGFAFGFATYYWILNIEKENINCSSILTGLFAGMAIVAKISYAASFLPSIAVILLWKIFTQPETKSFKLHILPFLLIGASAAFIAIQMPIKNQILFQNPLAPYGMADIFNQVWYGTDTIRKIYFSLPISLTFGEFWAQSGNITPLVLMFSPLIFLLPKPYRIVESPLTILSFASLIGLLVWFVYHPAVFAPRYFLAPLLLIILPSAKAAQDFYLKGKSNELIIQLSVIFCILYTGLYYSNVFYAPGNTLNLLFSGKPNCYIEPIRCEIDSYVNTELNLGERVFTNTRFRYWLRPDLIQCLATTSEMENYLSLGTSDLRWNFIVGRGFSIVFFENKEAPLPDTIQNDLQQIPNWLKITIIQQDDQLIIFRLTPQSNSHKSLYGCSQLNPPAWDIFEVSSP